MATTKELTIAGKIGLPASDLDAADIIHSVRGAIAAGEKLISDALGGEFSGFKFEVGVAVTRGPRAKATDTGNKT